MAKTLNDRILELEQLVKQLQEKLDYVSSRTEEITPTPVSQVPRIQLKQGIMPSTGTGLGQVGMYQGNIIFNNAENLRPAFGTQPIAPSKGYNKHSHSRYSGGALDIHTLELVEYVTSDPDADDPVILDANGRALNKHCQSYWDVLPKIVKADDNVTDKIGMLDIEFDSESKKWVAGASMIDVERTYLVQYEIVIEEGKEVKKIKTDENGNEMKSPLLYTKGSESENLNKSNVVWDADAECWRLYAVFKPYIEE
jgi:hypothetical protein